MRTIARNTTEIKTEIGTFHKALVTPKFIYFCNYEEGDMNGNTKMFHNSTLAPISDNYFASEDFLRAINEDEHIFISDYVKENMHLSIEAEMEMITDSVELIHDESHSEFVVYVNEEGTHFFAVSTDKKKLFRFKITKAIKDLTQEEKEATLHYRYSNLATDEMQVEFDDIFMEGKHIELIK